MHTAQSKFAQILQQHNLSITQPRRLLFETFESHDQLTMQQLCQLVTGRIDKATVYRIVEVFERLGIVKRVNIGWKYKLELSDAFNEHHHHLTCLVCGSVTAINEHDMETFIARIAAQHNFETTEHQIEIQGRCAACRKNKRTSPTSD